VDWERLVRRYPIPALLAAAVGGFLLGRSRGPAIVAALGAFAGRRVAASVDELLGEEVLD
jgi:outer membrane lipoprotein SlyB